MADQEQGKGYDPFADRLTAENTITDGQTLTHLIKATLGTGILSMPIAFLYAGLFMGIITTGFTALICGHCAYLLVKCGHKVYYKEKVSQMTFAEVTSNVFKAGPQCTQKLTRCIYIFIVYGMFFTYFGTCSVYVVIVAKNFQQVFEHWMGETYNERYIIAALLIPLILLTWIPNLKKLAPISMLANLMTALSLAITIYYLVLDLPPIDERKFFKFDELPSFFAVTIFALEAIGMIMPLENSMKTPKHFLGVFGILSQGMMAMTILCTLLGFLGYLRYGLDTEESITLNLPVDELPAQLVKLLIAFSIFCTYGLQFTVCLECVWTSIKDRFTEKPIFANYVVRTVLVVSSVAIAVAVPSIAPFMGLIGALFFSILGLMMPVILESILCMETGFGAMYWILWKNIFIVFFGIFALIFGSRSAIRDIMKLYE